LKLDSHFKIEGQMYLLAERSLRLNGKNNEDLLELFLYFVFRGNSVMILDHALDFIEASDWFIDFAQYRGRKGGEMRVSGTPEEMLNTHTSTAKWLKAGVRQHFT